MWLLSVAKGYRHDRIDIAQREAEVRLLYIYRNGSDEVERKRTSKFSTNKTNARNWRTLHAYGQGQSGKNPRPLTIDR